MPTYTLSLDVAEVLHSEEFPMPVAEGFSPAVRRQVAEALQAAHMAGRKSSAGQFSISVCLGSFMVQPSAACLVPQGRAYALAFSRMGRKGLKVGQEEVTAEISFKHEPMDFKMSFILVLVVPMSLMSAS